ncbi:type II toxin-antitoxin system VapC family toxin [Candidatus Peregrinibacteria bacterium]|nr:type II toxin-antitoxin system VapC family toxin [Candidatus Peregrinibacteria bacterium]
MKKLLFDTDVLIDILRNNKKTIEQVRKLTEEAEEFCCSTINVAEIFAGMRTNEEGQTGQLLEGLTYFNVTENLAKLAGRMKFRTKTHTLWLDDCLIAATAILNECILVTKNVKHYPFTTLKLVKIE